MRHATRWFALSAAAFLLIVLGVWGVYEFKRGAQEAFLRNRLQALGLANLSYQDAVLRDLRFGDDEGEWGVGPESWEELVGNSGPFGAELAEDLPVFQDNKVVVHWGYQFRYDPEQDDLRVRNKEVAEHDFSIEEFIFAYPQSARSKGGTVLLLNGATVRMAATELVEKLKDQGHEISSPVD